MKETRFIAQNKEKWLESEKLLASSSKDPEKLSNLFTQVVDDLSYSRTYYPNRSVRIYLNKIAREYFSILYRHHQLKKNSLKIFWLEELPQIMILYRKQMLVSLLVFLMAAAIGVFSSIEDPQFAKTILSDGYVEMTKENIQKGDPMAVYKKGHQVDMFLGITLNNLMVAFRTYVFGVFLSIGTLAILLYNGIMVGCFQFFFIERGLFAESALSIWLHGTLEISSIIIAGGAGLVLGSGLVFPGTYSRLQAFQLSAMRSLKIMLGITPIFILAAIIESFLTRYTEIPDFIRLLLIIFSAVLIVGYFVIYPWRKSKSGFSHPLAQERLSADDREPIVYAAIKSNAEILKDSFLFYKRKVNTIIPWIALISFLMALADHLSGEPESAVRFYQEWWQYFFGNLYYALKTPNLLFVAINTIGSTLILYKILTTFENERAGINHSPIQWVALLKSMALVLTFYSCNYWIGGLGSILMLISYLFLLLLIYAQFVTKRSTETSSTSEILGANLAQAFGLQFVLLLLSFSFLMILSAPLIYLYTSILQWNFAESDAWSKSIVYFIETFIKTFSFNLVMPIFAFSGAFLYHSLLETSSAHELKSKIMQIDHSKTLSKEKQ